VDDQNAGKGTFPFRRVKYGLHGFVSTLVGDIFGCGCESAHGKKQSKSQTK
jgi:hypothetical protein